MVNDYTHKLINEGFKVNRNSIEFTDENEYIVNTSINSNPIVGKIYSHAIEQYISVYSIFKRTNDDVRGGDSNPVIYALKNERGWKFVSEKNKQLFWNRFRTLLHRFLRDHNNEYETTIVIPSSNRLNSDIVSEIETIAKEVGITHISHGGLRTMTIEDVEDAILMPNSFFKKYWNRRCVDWEEKFDYLEDIFNETYNSTNGLFKYHVIPSNSGLRPSIFKTMEIDKECAFLYSKYINNKNILLVDDSITYGQSIHNALYAIADTYIPKTVSVLTMFSSRNGNKIVDPYDDFDAPYRR